MPIRIPHDALFKKIMESPLAAREFLSYYLPEKLQKMLDFATIKVEKDSFIEDDLKRKLSDLVYSLRIKESANKKAFVYVLLEHQSTPDHLIALRLWKYMLLLAERHQVRKGTLPVIAPIVVYNGSKPYTAARSLWELFTMPDIARELMAGDYKLVDLQSMADEEIKKKQHLGMFEYFMKHIHTRDILGLWDQFLSFFKEAVMIDQGNEYFYIKHFLWYTDTKVPEGKRPELEAVLLRHLSETDESNIMRSIADKYYEDGIEQGIRKGMERGLEQGMERGLEQGMERGLEQGMERGILSTAINMLRKRFDLQLIADVTGLSLKQIENLKASIYNS